jgi:hypothetical protein
MIRPQRTDQRRQHQPNVRNHQKTMRGFGIMDIATRAVKGLKNLSPTRAVGQLLTTTQAFVYGQAAYRGFMEMIAGLRSYGNELPDLAPELSLFLQESEKGPNMERNKAIMARILDMNRRYLQLNTTEGKYNFNRIMHTTVLNVTRNPDKAGDYLARAEMDLAKLFRAYLGSPEEQYETSKYRGVNFEEKTATRPHSDRNIGYDYDVEELESAAAVNREEGQLASSLLYNVPFPSGQPLQLYVPNYARIPTPASLLPRFRGAPHKQPVITYKRERPKRRLARVLREMRRMFS